MYLCYIDESGTPDVPGNTSHFVLAGLSIPVWHWSVCDRELIPIKKRYGLNDAEIHTAWLLRPYLEQSKIKDFDKLSFVERRIQVQRYRNAELLRLQNSGNIKHYRQTQKTYKHTEPYIHLAYDERYNYVRDLAQCVGNWRFARLFAECINKIYFDPRRTGRSIDEQAFEQVVSRFEQYLESIVGGQRNYGLLIHDNNPTVAKNHTELMKRFHRSRATLWTRLQNIIETPLYVDSQLTSMVQIADLCSFALRRYIEKGEEELFDLIFERADRRGEVAVDVRHYSENSCQCKICRAHKS